MLPVYISWDDPWFHVQSTPTCTIFFETNVNINTCFDSALSNWSFELVKWTQSFVLPGFIYVFCFVPLSGEVVSGQSCLFHRFSWDFSEDFEVFPADVRHDADHVPVPSFAKSLWILAVSFCTSFAVSTSLCS